MGFRWGKSAKKRSILSFIITLALLFIIIVAGPVEAVRVNLKTDKSVYQVDDETVVIMTSVDIQRNEIVPIRSLTLKINDGFKVCEFSPDGSESCPNIDIILINDGEVATDDMEAKGFGFVNETEKSKVKKTDFGYGYGFEDELRKSGHRGELKYEIHWDINADNVPNGNYEAVIEAFAENGVKQFTYLSRSKEKFKIKRSLVQPPSPPLKAEITDKVKIKSKSGAIDFIKDDANFTDEKNSFDANLRRIIFDSSENVQGRVAFSLYGEKNDSTKVRLDIDMKDNYFDLDSFGPDLLEFSGIADFSYSRTKKGVWQNHTWQGQEESVNLRGRLAEIRIIIEDGKIMVSSEELELPFEATFQIEEIKFS